MKNNSSCNNKNNSNKHTKGGVITTDNQSHYKKTCSNYYHYISQKMKINIKIMIKKFINGLVYLYRKATIRNMGFIVGVGVLFGTWYYANYARLQVKAMNDTIGVIDRNARLDQRAWVGVTHVPWMALKEKDTYIIRLMPHYSNKGKTPAQNIRTRIVGENICYGVKPDFTKEDCGISGHQFAMMPGQEAADDWDFKNVTMDSINHGVDCLCVHGIIEYDSIFGNHHWTRYCIYMGKFVKGVEGAHRACEDHNDIDNNEP